MFWIGMLVGVVSCLVLVVVLVVILEYVFPENLSKSILKRVRKREQKRKDQRACVTIRKTWPQLDDDQVEWLLRLSRLDGPDFEDLIAVAYQRTGYYVEKTGKPGDKGVDVLARKDDETLCIQCKSWDPHGRVSDKDAKLLMVARDISEATIGVIVSTARLTGPARTFLDGQTRIEAIVGPEVLDLVKEGGLLSEEDRWWRRQMSEDSGTATRRPSVLPAYPIPIRATVRDKVSEAQLLDASGRVRCGEVVYGSPSAAARAATGWIACNGWIFWQYQDPKSGEWHTIDQLRG